MNTVKEQPTFNKREILRKELTAYETARPLPRVYEIFEAARTEHDKMTAFSAADGWNPNVSSKAVQELLNSIADYARGSLGEKDKPGDLKEALKALKVLRLVKEQAKLKNPDARKVDNAIADFIKARIEEFFKTLPERIRLMNYPAAS